MTYNVFGGTLNLTQSINQSVPVCLCLSVIEQDYSKVGEFPRTLWDGCVCDNEQLYRFCGDTMMAILCSRCSRLLS